MNAYGYQRGVSPQPGRGGGSSLDQMRQLAPPPQRRFQQPQQPTRYAGPGMGPQPEAPSQPQQQGGAWQNGRMPASYSQFGFGQGGPQGPMAPPPTQHPNFGPPPGSPSQFGAPPGSPASFGPPPGTIAPAADQSPEAYRRALGGMAGRNYQDEAAGMDQALQARNIMARRQAMQEYGGNIPPWVEESLNSWGRGGGPAAVKGAVSGGGPGFSFRGADPGSMDMMNAMQAAGEQAARDRSWGAPGPSPQPMQPGTGIVAEQRESDPRMRQYFEQMMANAPQPQGQYGGPPQMRSRQPAGWGPPQQDQAGWGRRGRSF